MQDDDSRAPVAVIAHYTDETFPVASELRRLGGVPREVARMWKFPRTGLTACAALVHQLAELGVDRKVTIKRVAVVACPDCGVFPIPHALQGRVLMECAPRTSRCVITCTGGSAEHAIEVWNRRATDV